MTLKIKNIRYDHSVATNTYPEGALTVDSQDNSIHVHDGVQPNGVRLPTASDLNDKADVSLGNVSQEDITNLLSRYGALSMNDNKAISETQRNNAWDKLGGPAMRFDTEVPEHNVAVVNKDTHKLEVKDFATLGMFVGIDTTSAIARSNDVNYTATRDCWLIARAGTHVNWNDGWGAFIVLDGIRIISTGYNPWGTHSAKAYGPTSVLLPIKKGQTYRGTQFQQITEYGLKY